jgi:indole-3-acetate monooxygenase
MHDSDDRGARTFEAARELAPKIRAAADEIEQERRLPMHLVREMQRAGVFRMAMPQAWGGPELDFLTQLRVIEALSIADASAGWCTMIGVDGGYLTAYIDQAVAREMYRDLDAVTAVTFAPPGKAVKTRDGFVVNGRWPFGSGCQHATWLIGHFLVFDGDSLRVGPNGLPETRFGFLPAGKARSWTRGPPMACEEAAATIGRSRMVSSQRSEPSIWRHPPTIGRDLFTRYPTC